MKAARKIKTYEVKCYVILDETYMMPADIDNANPTRVEELFNSCVDHEYIKINMGEIKEVPSSYFPTEGEQ